MRTESDSERESAIGRTPAQEQRQRTRAPVQTRWRALRASLWNRRRWLRVGRDVLLLSLLLNLVAVWQARDHLAAGTAPNAVLRTVRGEPVRLDSLRGKPVLLAFWAPWCPVCRLESGNLNRAYRWVGDRATVILVAASYDNVSQVEASARAQALEAPVLLADDSALGAFRVSAFPTAYFIDAEGRVKRSVSGYTTTLGLVARLLF